jgi:hypothetical protein
MPQEVRQRWNATKLPSGATSGKSSLALAGGRVSWRSPLPSGAAMKMAPTLRLGSRNRRNAIAPLRRSETLDSEVVAINATSALHTAEFSRRRADGTEIGRLRATYLIIDGSDGRRICALAVHGG